MITITTEFNLSKEGRKSNLPDRPSDLLTRINPNDCYQLTGLGIPAGAFRWVEVYNGSSPIDPTAYVEDVLKRRRQFLKINHSGNLFEMMSCQIEIDSMGCYFRMNDGEWVTG